jgi:hypothetical protein
MSRSLGLRRGSVLLCSDIDRWPGGRVDTVGVVRDMYENSEQVETDLFVGGCEWANISPV